MPNSAQRLRSGFLRPEDQAWAPWGRARCFRGRYAAALLCFRKPQSSAGLLLACPPAPRVSSGLCNTHGCPRTPERWLQLLRFYLCRSF